MNTTESAIEFYEKKFDERTKFIAKELGKIKRVNWLGIGFVAGNMLSTLISVVIYWIYKL